MSYAPPARAFSHASVKTLDTEIIRTNMTDMGTFINYLESTSDTGLVLRKQIAVAENVDLWTHLQEKENNVYSAISMWEYYEYCATSKELGIFFFLLPFIVQAKAQFHFAEITAYSNLLKRFDVVICLQWPLYFVINCVYN